ncbi:MAG: site-2 protease family protein [Ruminococcus sp.]|nr:site-2 protease family protein [Ruminococcus sp.]
MDINNFFKLFARVLTLLLVLPLHEAAHAYVAHRMGDDTAKHQGRLTIHPFAHLDVVGSILIILTGFGWAKPVPVNPSRMKKPRSGMAFTALAGPVSNILAAFAAGLINAGVKCTESGRTAAFEYIVNGKVTMAYCVLLLTEFIMSVNVGLAVFNMIPIPPLDGFNVMRYFTGPKVDKWFYEHYQEIQMGFFAFLIILNFNIIPARYNLLYIIDNKVFDLIWNLVMKIPEHRWS